VGTSYLTANGAKKPPLGLYDLSNNLKSVTKTLTAVEKIRQRLKQKLS
jgi:hypothetical protein